MILTDEQILDYIDGNLEPSLREEVAELIAHEPGRSRYQELKQMDTMFSQLTVSEAPTQLSTRVMKSVEKTNFISVNGGIILLILVIITIISGSLFMVDGIISLQPMETLNLGYKNINIDNILPEGINLKMLNIGLLSVLSILSILLLEKVVLKPFFRKRHYSY